MSTVAETAIANHKMPINVRRSVLIARKPTPMHSVSARISHATAFKRSRSQSSIVKDSGTTGASAENTDQPVSG